MGWNRGRVELLAQKKDRKMSTLNLTTRPFSGYRDLSNPAYPEDNEKIKTPVFQANPGLVEKLKRLIGGGFSALSPDRWHRPEVSAKCPPLCVY